MWHDQGEWVTCRKMLFLFSYPTFSNLQNASFRCKLQTPLQLDIWLRSYERFDNAKNNIKQRNLNTGFANISKTTSPTSDSLLLIMSHIINDFVNQSSLHHHLTWFLIIKFQCLVNHFFIQLCCFLKQIGNICRWDTKYKQFTITNS